MTTAYRFRQSMDILMDRLRSSQQLYIRCIKPNDEELTINANAQSTTINEKKVYHQIRYLGILENVFINKAGYWYKISYKRFVARYSILLPYTKKENIKLKKTNRELTTEIVHQFLESFKQQHQTVAFGKTILFTCDAELLSSLELARMHKLEDIAIQLQAYIRGYIARHRFERLRLATKLLLDFHQYKLNRELDQIIERWKSYTDELKMALINTPSEELEYDQLPLFTCSVELIKHSTLAQNDRNWITDHLLPALDYLNRCLLIYIFPYEYWREQCYRRKAAECFGNGCKREWGQTRRRWMGNYLVDARECPFNLQIKALLHRHPRSFGFEGCRIRFSAFIVKTNRYDCLQVYGLVLVKSGVIYKIKLAPSLSVSAWFHVRNIKEMSVTSGADQIVVIHTIRAETGNLTIDNDLVFAFCSLKGEKNKIRSEDLLTSNQHEQGNKLGEFVTLVAEIYSEIYTNSKLEIVIGQPIVFRIQGQVYHILVIEDEQIESGESSNTQSNILNTDNINTNTNIAQRVGLELRESLRKLNTSAISLLHILSSSKTFYRCYARLVHGPPEQDKSNIVNLAQTVRVKKHGHTKIVMLYK